MKSLKTRFAILCWLLLGIGAGRAQTYYPLSLAWDASTDPTVVGFHLYYGCQSKSYTNVLSVAATNSVIVSNLVSGVYYYFALTDYTAAGLESDYSTELKYGRKPPAPTGLRTNQVLVVQMKRSLLEFEWVDTEMSWPLYATEETAFYQLRIEP